MSAPTASAFAPLVIAREALASQQFGTTDRANTRRLNGTAQNKREAAELWLDYITEGNNPRQADSLLRENGPALGYTANDIATGAWTARRCLKVGFGQTDRIEMVRLTVPASELERVIEILDMHPHFVSDFLGRRVHQNGYVSRGASAITFADGEQLAIRLLPGDPRTDKIEALVA